MAAFYILWAPDSAQPPRVRFTSYERAVRAAQALLLRHVVREVYILKPLTKHSRAKRKDVTDDVAQRGKAREEAVHPNRRQSRNQRRGARNTPRLDTEVLDLAFDENW